MDETSISRSVSTRKARDVSGQRFGHVVTIRLVGGGHHGPVWEIRCDCGNTGTRPLCRLENAIRKGQLPHCGRRCVIPVQKYKHSKNRAYSPRHVKRRVTLVTTHAGEHSVWKGMRRRCSARAKPVDRLRYFDRGARVHPEWRASFAAFLNHIGPRPSPLHSIDRYPDPNGNYEPGNVRWATATEQANNRRNTISLTVDGQTMSLSQWARKVGISVATLYGRIAIKGWEPTRAVKTPARPKRRAQKETGPSQPAATV